MVASIHPAVTVNKDLGEHESAEKKTLTENFGLGGSTAGLQSGLLKYIWYIIGVQSALLGLNPLAFYHREQMGPHIGAH